MRFAMLLAALALAACGREAAKPAAPASPAPPAAEVTDFSKPMLARGTEPFWTLKIEGTRFSLSRPQAPDLVFEAPGGKIQPGRGEWTAMSADGQTLTLTLYVSSCSDGMSETRYPMTAEIVLAGRTLQGCAAKLSDMPTGSAGG